MKGSPDSCGVMCASFSDDDVGKTVVNANGDDVGMVTAVEHDTIRVKPNAGITDSIKAALGWEETGEGTYPLQEASIDRVTTDEVRLVGDLGDEGRSTTGVGTSPVGDESGSGSGVGTDPSDSSGTLDRDRDEAELTESPHEEPRAEEGLSGDSDDVRSAEPRDVGTEIGSGSGTGRREESHAVDHSNEGIDQEETGGGEPTDRTSRTPEADHDDVAEGSFDTGEGHDRAGASERRGRPDEMDEYAPADSDADADSDDGHRTRNDGRSDTDLETDDDAEWPNTDSDTDTDSDG